MTFMVDGIERRSYLEGEKTDLKQFYTMMREGKVITTSLPNLQETEATMRAILDVGRRTLPCIWDSRARCRAHSARSSC